MLLLLGIAGGVCAQSGSLEGTARDASTREPLSGVHIRLVGASSPGMTTTYGAMSDRAGHFSMALIRPGTYVLSPERNGYLQVQPKAGAPVRRVTIKAGDHQTVSIPVEVARMRYWDESTHAFVAEPGTYQIMAGSSSTDLPLSASFSIRN